MGKGRHRLRGTLLIALSLVMLLTGMAPIQARPQSPAERLDIVPEGCDIPEHKPGEFAVSYESEEAMRAAPRDNVAETNVWGPPTLRLVFEEIKKEPDPEKRRALEEAKKKELETQPGVAEDPDGKAEVSYVWGPEHTPGEFWVRYESEEAMRAASKDNVVEEAADNGPGYGGVFAQRLRFEEIEDEPDPEKRRVMEEAKIEDLQKRFGVDRVGYAYPFVHQPGEFRVIYDSEEAMKVAPKENVVWEDILEGPGPFVGVQDLLFEEIRDEQDPKKRRDLEETKLRELQQRPGVRDATYVSGDEDPDCYWDMSVTPEGGLNFANARHKLYGYVCSSEGLEELFGGDADAQRRLCGIYRSNPEACEITHRPGEFIVHYRSEEAIWSAPRANVVQEEVSNEPYNEFFAQLLVFEEIKNEPDPDRQRATRVAKLQELEKRPGVRGVHYAIDAREQHQACVEAEFGEFEGPGKPRSGKPVAGKVPPGKAAPGKAAPGKAPARKASSGKASSGEIPPGKAAPGAKPVASEPGAGEPSSNEAGSGLYYYVCSPEGLEEVFGGDVDFQIWFCIPPGGGGGGGWCYPNCNKGIVERGRDIIGGGRSDGRASGRDGGKANGKAAYDAALTAARSSGNGGGASARLDLERGEAEDPGGDPATSGRAGSGKKDADAVSGAGEADAGEDPAERATDSGGSDDDAGSAEEAAGARSELGEGASDAGEGAETGEVRGSGTDEEDTVAEAGGGKEDADLGIFPGDAGDGGILGFLSDAFRRAWDGPGGEDAGETGDGIGGFEPGEPGSGTGEEAAGEADDGIFLNGGLGRTGDGPGTKGAEYVVAENAAASRDASGSYSVPILLGFGTLLAAGVVVARRRIWG